MSGHPLLSLYIALSAVGLLSPIVIGRFVVEEDWETIFRMSCVSILTVNLIFGAVCFVMRSFPQ